MRNMDMRFSALDIADLQAVVGKKMLKYKCDPFEFSTSVYGIVGIAFEDDSFAFTNTVKPMDYYGDSSLQLLSRLLIAPSQCLQSLEQCA